MAPSIADIARLDAEVTEHKRKEQHHRRQAIRKARERDALAQWFRDHGITVVTVPAGAAPKEARPR